MAMERGAQPLGPRVRSTNAEGRPSLRQAPFLLLRLFGLQALLSLAQEALGDVTGVGQSADYAAGGVFDDGSRPAFSGLSKGLVCTVSAAVTESPRRRVAWGHAISCREHCQGKVMEHGRMGFRPAGYKLLLLILVFAA